MLKRIYWLKNTANYSKQHFYLSEHFRRTYKALLRRRLLVDGKNFLKYTSLYNLSEIAVFCLMAFTIFRWKV